MLVDAAWGLVLVDHTRSFSAFTTPLELRSDLTVE